MIRIVVDESVKQQLLRASDVCEVVDAAGNRLGSFTPEYIYQCPFSEEELRQAVHEEGGRPLKDILTDLERQR